MPIDIDDKTLLSVEEIRNIINGEDYGGLPKRKKKKSKPFWREMAEIILIAVVAAFVLKAAIIEMYWVPTESMAPTIMVEDRIAVTKYNYWFTEPKRGDIVVFESPIESEKKLIKRLIGLPGDHIEFKDNVLYLNGTAVEETYLSDEAFTADYGPLVVPEQMYFMCGDNRQRSSDSRAWGLVSKKLLIGKGIAIYWPNQHIDWL